MYVRVGGIFAQIGWRKGTDYLSDGVNRLVGSADPRLMQLHAVYVIFFCSRLG